MKACHVTERCSNECCCARFRPIAVSGYEENWKKRKQSKQQNMVMQRRHTPQTAARTEEEVHSWQRTHTHPMFPGQTPAFNQKLGEVKGSIAQSKGKWCLVAGNLPIRFKWACCANGLAAFVSPRSHTQSFPSPSVDVRGKKTIFQSDGLGMSRWHHSSKQPSRIAGPQARQRPCLYVHFRQTFGQIPHQRQDCQEDLARQGNVQALN